jgi:hypothetical protein
MFAVMVVALTAYAISNRAVVIPVAAQAQACLHGEAEVPAERVRRFQALAVARDVNTMEAAAAAQANGLYQPLLKLELTRPTPDGFRLQLTTDGTNYAFSVKDLLDPCMFAYFSDQSGIILVGRVIQ